MESSARHPFKSFEGYLSKGINNDLEKFYNSYLNEDFGPRLIDVDKKNHTVKYLKDSYEEGESKYTIAYFEQAIKYKLQSEIIKLFDAIEIGFEKIYSESKDPISYARFLKLKLTKIKKLESLEKFLFLKGYIEKIQNHIDSFIHQHSKRLNHSQFYYSFNLLAKSKDEQEQKIKKLYELLTEQPPLISCTKEDFYNAFSGNEVKDGIKYLVVAKNKHTSKISLFYFLNQLINKGHIQKSILNDLIKYTDYVFRKNDGEQLKYLKDAKSKEANSKNPTQKERLDKIIASL